MKKLFLIISSIILSLNSNSCGLEIQYTEEANKNVLEINIADIPISVDLFMSFYYEKVVKFNVTSYPLMKFIRDLLTYCIINIFEDCFGEEDE